MIYKFSAYGHPNILGTHKTTLEFTKDEAVQILMNLGIDDIERLSKFKETVSGKEVFSALLPDDFNFTHYSRKCGKCEKQKKDFLIKSRNCLNEKYFLSRAVIY